MKAGTILITFLLLAAAVSGQIIPDGTPVPVLAKEGYQEKMTIFTNSTFFIPGERIYFKIYNSLSGSEPSYISRIAYVELVNENQEVVLRCVTELREGEGNGHLYLPSVVRSGSYELIAYSSWMRNYPLSNIPQKNITIVNPHETAFPQEKKGSAERLSMEFFPEGGGYSLNRDNRVVYKIKGPAGTLFSELKGRVPDQAGNRVATFRPDEKGSGHFYLHPASPGEYSVLLERNDGEISFHTLKTGKESGVALKVTERDDAFLVSAFKQAERELLLEVFSFEQPRFTLSFPLTTDSSGIILQKAVLPSGLIQLRLKDSQSGHVAQRLLYNSPETARVKINVKNRAYGPREKVRLTIGSPEELEGQAVTVTVRKMYKPDQSHFIFNAALTDHLNNGLEEAVEDGPYYLNPLNTEALHDLLISGTMVKRENDDQQINYLPDFRGQLIRGKVKVPALREKEVFMAFPGQDYRLYASRPDENGRFYFTLNDHFDENKFVLYSPSAEAKSTIEIDSLFITDHSFVRTRTLQNDPDLWEWLQRKSIDVQVENAYYAFRKDSIATSTQAGFLKKEAEKVYHLDDFSRFPKMEELFVEIIPELRLIKNKGKSRVIMPYLPHPVSDEDSVLLLWNGIPVSANELLTLNPLLTEKVTLLLSPVKTGSAKFQGVAVFQLYNQQEESFSLATNYATLKIESPQSPVIYYQPDYQNMDEKQTKIPDFRNQLLWNPRFILRKDQDIYFYTSDLTGTFKIVVQGITPSGKYIYGEETFEVSLED